MKLTFVSIAFFIIAVVAWLLTSINQYDTVTQDQTDTSPIPKAKVTANSDAQTAHQSDIDASLAKNVAIDRGNALIVVKRRGWRLGSPLSEHIDALKERFASGNAEAGYLLGANLRYCLWAPVDDNALNAKLKEMSEFSDADESIERENKRYDYCEGIETPERAQYFAYLFDSALAGYVQSQEFIGGITAEQYMKIQSTNELSRDELVAMRNEFNQHKLAFLEAAAKQGSVHALTRLSDLFNSQNYGEKGKEKAFALNQIILELTDNNDIYNRYTFFQERLRAQLNDEELDYAYTMSQQWLNRIQANGTLYPLDN
ncbi:MAG: hypothetical protein GJ680_06560 [Alteromonadaceae bacterium]|nr:hypothetical protein [Alteromonadaceae bacterium]